MKKAQGKNLSNLLKSTAGQQQALTTEDTPNATPASNTQPSRKDKKGIVVYVTKPGYKELANLGVDIDKTLQDMVHEAINDYLTKHHRNPIA